MYHNWDIIEYSTAVSDDRRHEANSILMTRPLSSQQT